MIATSIALGKIPLRMIDDAGCDTSMIEHGVSKVDGSKLMTLE